MNALRGKGLQPAAPSNYSRIPVQLDDRRMMAAPISRWQAFVKRSFDVLIAASGLVCTAPLILVSSWIAARETGASGFFYQTRVGRHGRRFNVVKIRTMRNDPTIQTTATTSLDSRITPWGAFFRRTKLDELPQLWNVLKGEMSLVGPRPDVPDVVESIPEPDRSRLLAIRPGITGPATWRYRDEESLLARQPDPERYSREVIFPDKVRINLEYLREYRLRQDVKCLWRTVFPAFAPPTAGTRRSPPRVVPRVEGRRDAA